MRGGLQGPPWETKGSGTQMRPALPSSVPSWTNTPSPLHPPPQPPRREAPPLPLSPKLVGGHLTFLNRCLALLCG